MAEEEKPKGPTGEEFLKAFEESRKEALQYHETLWKIAFAGLGIGSALVAINFAPHAKDAVLPVKEATLFLLTGVTVAIVGIATVILVHLYWYKYQTTIHFGNAFRGGWLEGLSASWVSARLDKVWKESQSEYRFALHRSAVWAAPGWLMVVAGVVLICFGK